VLWKCGVQHCFYLSFSSQELVKKCFLQMSGLCSSKELVEKYFVEGDNDVWTCK
jgi:hypothetical protein